MINSLCMLGLVLLCLVFSALAETNTTENKKKVKEDNGVTQSAEEKEHTAHLETMKKVLHHLRPENRHSDKGRRRPHRHEEIKPKPDKQTKEATHVEPSKQEDKKKVPRWGIKRPDDPENTYPEDSPSAIEEMMRKRRLDEGSISEVVEVKPTEPEEKKKHNIIERKPHGKKKKTEEEKRKEAEEKERKEVEREKREEELRKAKEETETKSITDKKHVPENENPGIWKPELDEYVKGTKAEWKYLGQGKLGGFFNYTEIWQIHHQLRLSHPDIVGKKFSFGSSLRGHNMEAFYIQKKSKDRFLKNVVLFDALHHAREFITLSMIVKIVVESVKELVSNPEGEMARFFENNRLLIVPIVNVDAFQLMCSHFGTPDWPKMQKIRKNLKLFDSSTCPEGKFPGVDLNRNYDIKFNEVKGGASNDPCDETYQGKHAFSEPETISMKNLIQRVETIVSAMNFHAYGGLWIYPTNYQAKEGENLLAKLNKRMYKAYSYFMETSKLPDGDKAGNAMKTIQYYASGEASDWMLMKANVFSFSPELGSSSVLHADEFYPSADRHALILNSEYPMIESFLRYHVPKLKRVGKDLGKELIVSKLNHWKKDQPCMLIALFQESGGHLSSVRILLKGLSSVEDADLKLMIYSTRKEHKQLRDWSQLRFRRLKVKRDQNGDWITSSFHLRRRSYLYTRVEGITEEQAKTGGMTMELVRRLGRDMKILVRAEGLFE